ncbi:MAG: acetyl-CoA carboxylase, biotin carboxyl carrier protein [candidate division Zixibacteria bacterium 4484_93]|nr:MAG: acetyl-CoA carboxylase, biotin carboxyl carrier protein [candidate division Zixibacteria bacterium 4484_93]RKZ34155.1 MAG: acetyl-CoA carboxylase, biotin carboxyl carrier protein [bacterium]
MDLRSIKKLIKLVEESDIGEIEISYFMGRKIRIAKYPRSALPPQEKAETEAEEKAEEKIAPPSEIDESIKEKEGFVSISAPIVGTFYRAPSPDAEPYVRVGDHIEQGTVVCIIEAMKLFNEIKSEIGGTIKKILVENGQPVEYGQTLFLVESD